MFYEIYDLQYDIFSPICGLYFHLLDGIIYSTHDYNYE